METSENDSSFIHCQSTVKKPNRIFKGCISRFLGYNKHYQSVINKGPVHRNRQNRERKPAENSLLHDLSNSPFKWE